MPPKTSPMLSRRLFLARVAGPAGAATVLGVGPFARAFAQPSAPPAPPRVPEGLALVLYAPELATGDRKALRAELLFDFERLGPVMLTPTAEGTAVEVVRGRLTGEDAEPFTREDGRRGLAFAIPVAAHMAGTSVVRVQAHAYGCDGGCRAVEASAQLTLRVARTAG